MLVAFIMVTVNEKIYSIILTIPGENSVILLYR